MKCQRLSWKVKSGALSLSNLVKAQSYFRAEAREDNPRTRESKALVLEQLANKSVRDGERMLLAMASKPTTLQKRLEWLA